MPLLREHRGSIVNIASTRALQSEPQTEAYAASKGGLVAFTHALSVSAGPEVRVNCINPGWIDTRPASTKKAEPLREIDHQQHPAGRVGKPADVAALVAFLVGPQADFITGQAWAVDGGMTKRMIYAD
jgi:NAD(P)-dependent dehydrogenase (short-subunit alcohol dehydrogenase family)